MYGICLGIVMAVVLPSSVRAAVVLGINAETLNAGNTTGSAVVTIQSTLASELVGAFNLDLQVSAFGGNLAGQAVTITSVTPNFGAFLPGPAVPVVLTSGGTVNLQGFVAAPPPVGSNEITTTARNFFTINFSVPNALAVPTDQFTFGFTNTNNLSVVNTGFAGIFQSSGIQLVAVPEPSSALLVMGLVGVGAVLRRRRTVKASGALQ